jgi:hypothetical protein
MTFNIFSQIAALISCVYWIEHTCVDAYSVVRIHISQQQQQQQQQQRQSTRLYQAMIRPESVDFDFDVGQGGVRLAEESVIKITGTVTHRPGHAEPTISKLVRYTQIRSIDNKEQTVISTMQQVGSTIIAAGRGTELYKDPGTSTEQIILYAPTEAVRDSLIGAKSAMQCSHIIINFCSGDDAQVLEVLSAITKMVLDLDIATRTKISFNSISHSTFPKGTSAVTVVSVSDDESTAVTNTDDKTIQGIASGEVYFRDGSFYVLCDDDINSAIA